jgi:predicted GNAT family acetyltransferase
VPAEDVTVADRPERNRYEIAIGDDIAYLDYRRRGNHITLVHTEVPVALRNRGLGTVLAKHGLDEARRAGSEVVVACPFITTWLRRHHQYDDIIVARVHEDGSLDRQRPNDGPR